MLFLPGRMESEGPHHSRYNLRWIRSKTTTTHLEPRFISDITQTSFVSCNDLSVLRIPQILHSGYISPKASVTCVSALPQLANLEIGFESLAFRSDWRTRSPPPGTRRPPCSHPLPVLRCQRILGGPRGPNQCSSTQRGLYNTLQSTHL
jgi:hypothetical protein